MFPSLERNFDFFPVKAVTSYFNLANKCVAMLPTPPDAL